MPIQKLSSVVFSIDVNNNDFLWNKKRLLLHCSVCHQGPPEWCYQDRVRARRREEEEWWSWRGTWPDPRQRISQAVRAIPGRARRQGVSCTASSSKQWDVSRVDRCFKEETLRFMTRAASSLPQNLRHPSGRSMPQFDLRLFFSPPHAPPAWLKLTSLLVYWSMHLLEALPFSRRLYCFEQMSVFLMDSRDSFPQLC